MSSIYRISSQNSYGKLYYTDSIRLLELTRVHHGRGTFTGHLSITQLSKQPDYTALSYCWGEPSAGDPILLLDQQPLQIRASLWQALNEVMTRVETITLWIDQVCIDQDNESEKEQQVQLMSQIYRHARLVVGWLGTHDNDSDLAFHLFAILGRVSGEHNEEPDGQWQRAVDVLMKSGHLQDIEDLYSPYRRPIQAAASLLQRPWFRRLWIVQEVTLASALEFCCGSSSIPGDVFFTAIRILSSIVSDPPMPWLLKPYRNALKLGQLRAQVFAGHNHSFPHLAHALSGWDCKMSHDRLIALFGLIFQGKQAWFTPSYKISSPQLYAEFAQGHMHFYEGLELLHFAGCGDSSAHTLVQTEDHIVLQLNPPADDIPSWVPDWRVQSRPLTLLPNIQNAAIGFSATASNPDFKLNHHILHVRAREVDRITICGLPYCESLGKRLKMTELETFNHWFNLAKTFLKDADVESMFASTLVMDGKVVVAERQDIGVNTPDVPCLFGHWAAKNLDKTNRLLEVNWKDGIEDSTRYGYIAEEICRNRTFFITEAGRLGLGSVHVSPGASIYLIHGLKVPFVIHHDLGMQVLRGECYVYGLMDGEIQCSDQDSLLHLM
jgi:hypothetical protein